MIKNGGNECLSVFLNESVALIADAHSPFCHQLAYIDTERQCSCLVIPAIILNHCPNGPFNQYPHLLITQSYDFADFFRCFSLFEPQVKNLLRSFTGNRLPESSHSLVRICGNRMILPINTDPQADRYDFRGKTIIPFNTHMGSGEGGTYDTIRKPEPKAKVLTGLSVITGARSTSPGSST